MNDLFDLELGRSGRDHGAGLASDNAGKTWNERAMEIALSFFRVNPYGGLFEDVREYASQLGHPEPPSPNAWGAVALAMSKRKLIVKTGEWRQSKYAKSHARSQPVWRLK